MTFLSLPQLLISLIDFAFPAEVRDCRHKINWFQILIPLTAELSRTPRHRSPIHPNSINVVQTNKRRKTGTRRTSLLLHSVLLFSPLHHWLMFIPPLHLVTDYSYSCDEWYYAYRPFSVITSYHLLLYMVSEPFFLLFEAKSIKLNWLLGWPEVM